MKKEDLQKALELLLFEVNRLDSSDLYIDRDYYWDIEVRKKYDISCKPEVDMLGQLSHDSERVMGVVMDPDKFIYHYMKWLGNILIYYGEELDRR